MSWNALVYSKPMDIKLMGFFHSWLLPQSFTGERIWTFVLLSPKISLSSSSPSEKRLQTVDAVHGPLPCWDLTLCWSVWHSECCLSAEEMSSPDKSEPMQLSLAQETEVSLFSVTSHSLKESRHQHYTITDKCTDNNYEEMLKSWEFW